LQLLLHGPLRVAELQEILGRPQVFISKHLAYLRGKKLVRTERFKNWIAYSVPKRRSVDYEAHLQCLQECSQAHLIFRRDMKRLRRMAANTGWVGKPVFAGAKGKKGRAAGK
jgi:hypothetical protein